MLPAALSFGQGCLNEAQYPPKEQGTFVPELTADSCPALLSYGLRLHRHVPQPQPTFGNAEPLGRPVAQMVRVANVLASLSAPEPMRWWGVLLGRIECPAWHVEGICWIEVLKSENLNYYSHEVTLTLSITVPSPSQDFPMCTRRYKKGMGSSKWRQRRLGICHWPVRLSWRLDFWDLIQCPQSSSWNQGLHGITKLVRPHKGEQHQVFSL